MPFTLPKLNYELDALSPYISAETLQYHYGKHHQGYINKLNKMIEGTEWEKKSLPEIITGASGGMFNNAAQAFNHEFYWNGLDPQGGAEPEGELLELINRDFGSFADFKEQFTQAALTLFGSGWVWLAQGEDGKLAIKQSGNAGNPLTDNEKPLLNCDVWEHAYYIDYRNARAKYVESFWQIVNWQFVNNNLAG